MTLLQRLFHITAAPLGTAQAPSVATGPGLGILPLVLARLSTAAHRLAARPMTPATPQEKGRAKGHIALVGAGPGARDLLTLRAVQRIQAADVVFYDRLVEPEVVALASPKAKRVFVGKHVGAHSWPQERINAAIVTTAKQGLRVVRLKSGDPSIFGRAGEELNAARQENIEVEIVPGVTSASAAAAELGQSLTERGIADTLILTTGMSRAGAALPDSARFSGPGTTTAFYMSVAQAGRIRDALLARGLPADAPVNIAVDVSKQGQRLLSGRLEALEHLLSSNQVKGCAMILVTWPTGVCAKAPSRALLDAHAGP
ncbi:uroporphyrinogen-III C-methyltransferase [Phaeobacter sp. QD34_3]|uniref:uroporphyrinogen-III C-methyltransferase n=1 Tax=unclassified Phaeobacter TaxID=2621772 RepID=UPI00237F913A|nr:MULTISPECIES: uroporphyrinogen-III C-methyltransferase [unclassified Phaeobacter]MDE4133890.1 uroporphyrinogen-III C-methyltransferase [Phaeobacter sp. QD34_3]MDE4137419.1 uroporphyrinogen-III C-methyltransferase [Phaeobacter sp. QD34_24]